MRNRGVCTAIFASSAAVLAAAGCPGCDRMQHLPAALDTVVAEDQTVWERVSEPGFGNLENAAVVAMHPYKGRLYALVRNDTKGAEVWRTAGSGWEQVPFPNGHRNGLYGNYMINSHMGSMIVFKDKLYVGFSAGLQGNYLKSSGCEIWRYDGLSWEPVISDKRDTEETGTITGISGCDDNDLELTAFITDTGKSWDPDQWAGAVLQITSGQGIFRRFDIIANSADTLTVQQNEIAGERGTEYTVCGKKHYKNPFPPHEYDLEAVETGDSYEIGSGWDENGFGDYFNKICPNMTLYKDRLYATTAMNYDYGGQVWYTEDGDEWVATKPERSMGLFHDDPNYRDSKKPVTRGIPALCVCDVSGEELLYAGTLGSEGNLGSCARLAKLTDTGWELIVDASVDENDEGTNENGFGGGMDCTMFNGNFNVWTMSCFDDKLFVGFQSLGGARVLYSWDGSSEDGSWFYSVGEDGPLPSGFDGLIHEATADAENRMYRNIAVTIYAHDGWLYAGLVALYMPEVGATEEHLTGSQLWKTRDGTEWVPVTGDGFGDPHVLNFEAFTVFNDTLYVSASRAANTVGGGLGGATVYRMRN